MRFCDCISGFIRAAEGIWERTEDGKYWQYVYGPNHAVTDEWMEIDGKEYYFDQNGRMKTGWVVNKEDGNRYYMGKTVQNAKICSFQMGNLWIRMGLS